MEMGTCMPIHTVTQAVTHVAVAQIIKPGRCILYTRAEAVVGAGYPNLQKNIVWSGFMNLLPL